MRRNEADGDAKALQSAPFTEPDASVLEINTKERFTPNVFKAKVQFSVEADKKCSLIEILFCLYRFCDETDLSPVTVGGVQ